jgi:hypothetical protein
MHSRAVTAVAASVCLSAPMQMAQTVKIQANEDKTDIVDKRVLKDLVQVSR